jgi:hypothetical protein
MKRSKTIIVQIFTLLVVANFISSCVHKINNVRTDLATLEKEIELRLREYERHLRNEDSVALGNMYLMDAEVIPSTVGRENITKVFGKMIRNNITGSSFKTVHLWGNNQLLVEEGTAPGVIKMAKLLIQEDIYWSGKKIMESGKYFGTPGSPIERSN